jgi:hypothetical protein
VHGGSAKPIGLTLIPVIGADLLSLLIDDVETSGRECDHGPAVVVPMQVEWLIGKMIVFHTFRCSFSNCNSRGVVVGAGSASATSSAA